MNVVLAGQNLAVEPGDGLSAAEVATLGRLGGTDVATAPAFRLRAVAEPPWPAEPDELVDGAPARVMARGSCVRVGHHRFQAELDLDEGTGRIFRTARDGSAFEIVLRVALAARLPSAEGVALHAAGLVMRGRGVAFFGVSGAGKSTLSAASPHPVLSDEMVAVLGRPWRLSSSGFWGEMDGSSRGAAPLAAVVELAHGPRLDIRRLSPSEAMRRLLPTALVPPHDRLWREAMAVLGRLVVEVPAYRMAWKPGHLDWDAVGQAFVAEPQHAGHEAPWT